MDISNYLVELIVERDQVIVPGLGRFFKKRKSGFYDEATKTYYPPSGELDFSSEYMHDDKLVHLISQKSQTSLTSAYAILDEYIREIKLALKTGDFSLAGIGVLKIEEGQIALTPEKRANPNQAFFGLPAVDTESERLIGKESETYSLAQQALNTALPDELFEEEPKRGVVAITMGIIAVVILAGVIALYFARPDIYKNLVNQIHEYSFNQSPTPIAPVEPQKESPNSAALLKADSIYQETDIESKLKAEGFEVEKAKDSANVSINKNVLAKKGKFKYEIIIGLYTRREDAVKRVVQLKANGIDAHIVDDEEAKITTMTKISCATLYDDAEAEKELKRIKQELNPEAFKLTILILK